MANNKTRPGPEKKDEKRKGKKPKEDTDKQGRSEENDFGGIPGGRFKKNLGCGG